MKSEREEILIIGAGIMGSAIARALAKAGRSVRVLEKSIPGAEASSVAAGILAPLVEHADGPLRALGCASRDAYAALADELARETGLDIGFVRCGVLQLGDDARVPPGARAERLEGAALRALAPGLAPSITSALHLPDEAQVESPKVLRALVRSAEMAGARFTSGTIVRGLVRRGDRIVGVETDQGEVHASEVVLAAGAWTSLVPGLPPALRNAVRPVRGQLLRAELRAPICRPIVFAAHVYLVPRPDGRVVCGATMEEAGFDKTITLGAVATLASHAVSVLPALATARFAEADVSFRPASIDGLPLIGPSGIDGLTIASGHFRNGILLAPATAELLAAQLAGAKTALDARPFDPRRLAEASAS